MKIRLGFVSNSSSSSFVCDVKRLSIPKVEENLRTLLDFYNDFFNEHLQMKNVFKKPFYADTSYSIDMSQNWGYRCPVGSLVIESAEDNSIPYQLFDIIERKFNAYRNHLG